jgi:hypothetical protein
MTDTEKPQTVGRDGIGDSLDLEKLRLSQDFNALAGVRKALLTVPVRKPDRQWFIRVHPQVEYRLPTALLNLKEERECYLVDRPLWSELPGEITPMVLYTAISRQGVVFLWPVRLPGEDGRIDEWNRSAMEAAELATTMWVRIAANMHLGAYEVFEATGDLPNPEWPDVTFQALLEAAFKDRVIGTLDHPVIQRLRGAV